MLPVIPTPPAVTDDQLAALKKRTAYLREQIVERKLQRKVQLQESSAFWMDPYQDLVQQLRVEELRGRAFASKNDRRWGRYYPVYQTEQELSLLRAPSRLLLATNGYAAGLMEGLSSYVNGVGFTYKMQAKDETADAPLADAAQKVVDDFLDRNCWLGGEQPGVEDEQFWRSHEDGESIIALTTVDDGRTEVRHLEPERITLPPGMDFRRWGFGVETDENDTEKPLSYWYQWGETSYDGLEYSPDEIIHLKRNVRRVMKRGVPSFSFDTYETFYKGGQLVKNLGEGAADQAAIAFIREHAQATVDQVNDFVNAHADTQDFEPWGLTTVPTNRHRQGRVEDIPQGMKYVAPPTAQNSPIHLQVLQGLLRAGGVRFNAPEWLVSADASDHNYSQSLTSESPFVRYVLRDQRSLKHVRKQAVLRALENWCRHHGGLEVMGVTIPWEVVRARLELQVEAPSPEVRDKLKEAQTNKIKVDAKVLSPRTWQLQDGLDPDQEEQNWEAFRAANPEPAMPGAGGGPGGDGGSNAGNDEPPPPGDDAGVAESLALVESLLMEAGQFDASKHPRDKNGKFIPVAELAAAQHAGPDSPQAHALRAKVRPEDRQKLERRLKGGKAGERKAQARADVESLAARYEKLLTDKSLSLEDARSQFAEIAAAPRHVLAEIAAKKGFTTDGTKEQLTKRLLGNVEGVHVSRRQVARIGQTDRVMPSASQVTKEPPASAETPADDSVHAHVAAALDAMTPDTWVWGLAGQNVKREADGSYSTVDKNGVMVHGDRDLILKAMSGEHVAPTPAGPTKADHARDRANIGRIVAAGRVQDEPAPSQPAAPPVAELHPKIPVYVRGNTFTHKDRLKSVGTWDPDMRAWRVTQAEAQRLKAENLPGLNFTVRKQDVEFYHPERFPKTTESLEEGLDEMSLDDAGAELRD